MPARNDDQRIEGLLEECVARAHPPKLATALAYALGGSGSRTRPRFCLAVARAAAGDRSLPPLAFASAAAVEMVHCASLAHDDLPCFDDAATRRGRPSLHREYGEAMALLTGDALIIEAFRELGAAGAPPSAITILAEAAGPRRGLVSGQAMELVEVVDVARYHAAKTGALFEAAAALGAGSVGADPAPYIELGKRLGAFYQLADDVADAFGDAIVLGKPVRKDVELHRPAMTFAGRPEAERSLREMARAIQSSTHAEARDLRRFVEVVVTHVVDRALRTPAHS